jgi:phytoene dehydrogenase-like protein
MSRILNTYDVVIIGAGHNGLVAASYLGKAGLSVLMLERNATIGGATRSATVFSGRDARLSVYSYLVSLFPQKILDDLGLDLELKSRPVASYTPRWNGEQLQELLVSNESVERTRASFEALPGGAEDYRGYVKLQEMQASMAKLIWPTLLEPLQSRKNMMAGLDRQQRMAWDAFMENPLGQVIEQHIASDLVRGMLFTDAKIGVCTHPHDPSLLQNLTFLYHIIGRETGEWAVPVGGMGSLAESLEHCARRAGVTIQTSAVVESIHENGKTASIVFDTGEGTQSVDARYVLCNAAPQLLHRLLGNEPSSLKPVDEGSVVKINMLLKRLPRMQSTRYSAEETFGGTFHIDEGYEQMTRNYEQSMKGILADRPGGEMYCHSLTDNTILSGELNEQGYHTLTLFGLDMPYAAFEKDNDRLRAEVLQKYLDGINRFTVEPLEECLAMDAKGDPCIEIKTPVDLEEEIHLPRGNIFHNALTWPFAEDGEQAGSWGVETSHENIFLCGSGAQRGGAVSGIPGHNAAMKVLSLTSAFHPVL